GGNTAKDALDRITIPQNVLDSIASTASPRSSITISDEPLNPETNYRTEVVVVLNDQPQGGPAMRPRPPPVPLPRSTATSASDTNGSGFNQQREGDFNRQRDWGFQSGNTSRPSVQQFYDPRQDQR